MNKEVSKTQFIRLLDIGVIGPVMIYVALTDKPDKFLRSLLFVFGALTITYNLSNYLKQRELISNGQF